MMHDDVAFAGGPYYWCRKCQCQFSVPWIPAQRDSATRPRLAAVAVTVTPRGPVLVPVPVPAATRQVLAA
jgi:hypothetical protein